jgi:hypothetical protein
MRTITKAIVTLAAAAAVSTSVAACSSSGGSSSSSSAASASSTVDPKAPLASVSSLTGKSTSVALDSGFVTALTTLGLTPTTLGTATLANGAISFPITGGNVNYYKKGVVNPYVTGNIIHDGSGLQLTAGATSVELTNFDINPGNSKLYGDVEVNNQPFAKDVYLFNLDGSTLQPLQANAADGTAVLTGTRVLVSPDAAAALNKVFSTTAVTAGLLVGVATITINTK